MKLIQNIKHCRKKGIRKNEFLKLFLNSQYLYFSKLIAASERKININISYAIIKNPEGIQNYSEGIRHISLYTLHYILDKYSLVFSVYTNLIRSTDADFYYENFINHF